MQISLYVLKITVIIAITNNLLVCINIIGFGTSKTSTIYKNDFDWSRI